MKIPNITMEFKNVDIFETFFDILNLSSAHTCRLLMLAAWKVLICRQDPYRQAANQGALIVCVASENVIVNQNTITSLEKFLLAKM